MALCAIELCAGYGGFTLGFRHGGFDVSTVAYVERDSYAASILVARMEEQRLDQAPIWDDLCTFDGAAWRGRVDIVTAGFPCQPFSTAGKQHGVDDDRWIWPDIAKIVADVGPSYVFLENVTGLVRHGLPHVLADLADLGFDAEWGVLSAADVGAPHRRQRVWVLGYARGAGRPEVSRGVSGDETKVGGEGNGHGDLVDSPNKNVAGYLAHAPGPRCEGDRPPRSDQEHDAVTDGGKNVADAAGINEREPDNTTRTQSRGHTRPDVSRVSQRPHVKDVAYSNDERHEPHHVGTQPGRETRHGATAGSRTFPPRPDDAAGWEAWTASGGPQPAVRRGPHGRPAGLADALHLGGNGLVPQAAAEALKQLLKRAGEPIA